MIYLPCPKCGSEAKTETLRGGTIAVSCSSYSCTFYIGFVTVNLWQQLDRSQPINLQDVYKQFELSLRVLKEENDDLKGRLEKLVDTFPADLIDTPLVEFVNDYRPLADAARKLKQWMEKHG